MLEVREVGCNASIECKYTEFQILSREFAITGFRTLAMEANIVMAASWWGKIKTTTQMIMIIVVLLNINSMQMIEWVLITLATFFTIVSGVDYIVKNKNVLKG